ncbi:MAG: hypothetical protein QXK88_10660 [Desulfurococcaceae archaeon]
MVGVYYVFYHEDGTSKCITITNQLEEALMLFCFIALTKKIAAIVKVGEVDPEMEEIWEEAKERVEEETGVIV